MEALRNTMVDTLEQTPLSLLLVDDDKPFRNRMARAMEKRGFDVGAADSGRGHPGARRRVRRGRPAAGRRRGLDVVGRCARPVPTAASSC